MGSIQYKLSAAAIDILNNLVRTGAILTETPISIFAEMLARPLDLDVSIVPATDPELPLQCTTALLS